MWKIKHENTAWHSNVEDDDFDIPDMDDLKGASHDAYLMNQRITSETFRYKFLNYNRSWLVNQLPSMLTPRTLKRSRPYLINQFSRILNQLNRDVSSDSDDDSPDYGPVALTATSRKIIRWWLAKARKQVGRPDLVDAFRVCLDRQTGHIGTSVRQASRSLGPGAWFASFEFPSPDVRVRPPRCHRYPFYLLHERTFTTNRLEHDPRVRCRFKDESSRVKASHCYPPSIIFIVFFR